MRIKGYREFKALNPQILAQQSVPHVSCHSRSRSYENQWEVTFYMSVNVLSVLTRKHLIYSLQQPYEVGTTVAPILQMRKRRLREVKWVELLSI